jgi:PAS domain S-box-containing protein
MTENDNITNSDKGWTEILEKLVTGSPTAAYIAQDGVFKFTNDRFVEQFGRSREEIIGQETMNTVHSDDVAVTREAAVNMLKGKRSEPYEYRVILPDESVHWIRESVIPVVYHGSRAVWGYYEDITERKQYEEELLNHRQHLESLVSKRTTELTRQADIIQQQAQEILEVSTPVMQVWEGILVAPLIGTLDSQRTQQFMERLLERIVETNSPVVLVDITGVPTIDTQTAQHLIDTISAVRLLGAQVILTGVRPPIAQTLVHLGVDLSTVTTRSSLSAGLSVAMNDLGLKVTSSNEYAEKEA